MLTRLLLGSVLLVVLAVTATAWLAARTTTLAIQQEQGRSLSDQTRLYDVLEGYAATHRDWSGVTDLVSAQAPDLDRRITLTTQDRRVLADSGPGPSLATTQPLATIDPLRLDLGLTGGTDQIDSRVVGPYALDATEVGAALKAAQDAVDCLGPAGVKARIADSPSGRPVVEMPLGSDPKGALEACTGEYRHQLFPTERKAVSALTRLTANCLDQPNAAADISIQVDWGTVPPTFSAVDRSAHPADKTGVQACLQQSRRTQLAPYVAPAALLFVTDADPGQTRPTFTLSHANVVRIIAVSAGVLAVAVLLTVLLGRRLIRPLRLLTQQATGHQAPARLGRKDEIGVLATALDDANQRRDRAEAQRRAMVLDIAHELRSPLTNVRSWLEAAQDGLASIDPALVDLLHEETGVLQHVVEDLTDLAAADAGTLALHLEPVDLRTCLEQVVDAHASAADAAGVRLVEEFAEAGTAEVDSVRLRQLVGNLLTNAIRHTPQEGTVTTRAEQHDGTVTIVVADTGSGIATTDLPRVFDRFWRADGSRTRGTGGSGLGLSIVRHLAEAHGGQVRVESALDHGTTFTVTIPAHPHLASSRKVSG